MHRPIIAIVVVAVTAGILFAIFIDRHRRYIFTRRYNVKHSYRNQQFVGLVLQAPARNGGCALGIVNHLKPSEWEKVGLKLVKICGQGIHSKSYLV